MKKIYALLMLSFSAVSTIYAQQYGKTFDAKNAMETEAFTKAMESKDKMDGVIVTGTITEVCQAAGCWLKLENEGGEDIFVKFKEENGNHELVVPKDIAGKTATVYGRASKKVISVKEQKHYAEDAGATEEELKEITKPKQQLRIDAAGVVVN